VGDNAKQNQPLAAVARPAELLTATRLTRSAKGQGRIQRWKLATMMAVAASCMKSALVGN